MIGIELLLIGATALFVAAAASVCEDVLRLFLYGKQPHLYFRGENRLSNCCAEKVLGEYDWAPLDEPPTGICRGCRDHSVFYTEEEFEEIDLQENGYNYGQQSEDYPTL